jgi:hypothetical protein
MYYISAGYKQCVKNPVYIPKKNAKDDVGGLT